MKKKEGFTLVELLIIVVIAGILATLLIPRIVERPDEARRIRAKADIGILEYALNAYKIDNGSYPTTEQGLRALLVKPETGPKPKKWREGGYLEGRRLPRDPWGNPFSYVCPGPEGRSFMITSYGADGEPGGTGKNADVSSVRMDKE